MRVRYTPRAHDHLDTIYSYYRIIADEVVILHVRDARRAPWTGEN
jgi:hypothetical protein